MWKNSEIFIIHSIPFIISFMRSSFKYLKDLLIRIKYSEIKFLEDWKKMKICFALIYV